MNALDITSRDDPDPGRITRSEAPATFITTKQAQRLDSLTLDLIEDAILYGYEEAIRQTESRVNGETLAVIKNIDGLKADYVRGLSSICKGIKDAYYVRSLRRNPITQPSAQLQ